MANTFALLIAAAALAQAGVPHREDWGQWGTWGAPTQTVTETVT